MESNRALRQNVLPAERVRSEQFFARSPRESSREVADVRTVHSRVRLLCIDDDHAFCRYLIRLLPRHGIEVSTEPDGARGLAAAGRVQPNVIVLDQCLPDTTGVAVLKRLRELRISIPVLLLTGFGTMELAAEATRAGADDCRSKPLVGKAFLDTIRTLLSGDCLTETSSLFYSGGSPSPSLCEYAHSLNCMGPNRSGDQKTDHVQSWLPLLGAVHLSFVDFVAVLRINRSFLTGLLTAQAAAAALMSLAHSQPSSHSTRRRALLALERHVLSPTGALDAVAADLQINRGEVTTFVMKTAGVSYSTFRRIISLRAAILQLATTSDQVAQIAYGLGYQHPSRLDNEFKRCLGVSPRAFRRLLRPRYAAEQ